MLFVFGCATGNCRSEKMKQEKKEGPMPPKDNKLIPETSLSERVKVFKYDGTLQCAQGKKIDLNVMQKDLKDIKVYNSFSD
ncbi:MAG: hypothetical protein L6Q37_16585, partial [Bdellovibrionaceae bacterium]|nr:hypothetical protein [Pseudobdellovibrionaceae bacterium]